MRALRSAAGRGSLRLRPPLASSLAPPPGATLAARRSSTSRWGASWRVESELSGMFQKIGGICNCDGSMWILQSERTTYALM